MAAANWLDISPKSGSGNGSITVKTLNPFTGRTQRQTTVTVKAAGVPDREVTVNQAGKAEFVTIESTKSVAKSGGNVTITGTSNSAKLTFSLGTGDLSFTLPAGYTANSVVTNNGSVIAGDPGAAAEYAFAIELNIGANNGVTALTKQIIVTANGAQSSTCTLTQSAGDPTLSVAPSTVNLNALGDQESITVTSNTNWTVE